MNERSRRIAFVAAMVVAVGYATIRRLPAFGPASLWLDDQWVALLVRHGSLADLRAFAPPVPAGFVALLWAVTSVFGDGSATLQALPALCALVLVPVTGLLAWRITGYTILGAVAAALIAADALLATYSMRVKPFAIDALATALLAWVFVGATQRPSPRAVARLALGTAAALPFSFAAVLAGAVFLHIAALVTVISALRDRDQASRRAVLGTIGACAAFDLVVAATFALVLGRHSDSAVFSYWDAWFLPLDDFARAWAFVSTKGLSVLTGAFPQKAPRLSAVGVAVGLLALVLRRESRAVVAGFAAVFVVQLAASALHLYPVGGGRTDIFTHPLTAVLAVAGLGLPFVVLPRGAASVVMQLAVAVAIAAIVATAGAPAKYPPTGDRDVVERAVAEAAPDDTVVIYPWANWAVALYAPWPIRLVREPASTNGFYAVPERPRTLVLREARDGASFLASPAVARVQIDEFLGAGPAPPRILLIAAAVEEAALGFIREALQLHGYVRSSSVGGNRATFDVFKRASGAPDPDGERLPQMHNANALRSPASIAFTSSCLLR